MTLPVWLDRKCSFDCSFCRCSDDWKKTQTTPEFCRTASVANGRLLPGPIIPVEPRADSKQVGGDHYKMLAIQPSIYIRRNKIGWYEGNAIKYITRHSIKGGRQDIEKAIHYLELLLLEDYGSTSPQETK